MALVLNGSVDISLFAADGISHKSSEQQNFNLNFKPNWGQEDRKLGNQDSNFHDTGKDLKTSPVNENDDFNENTWDFKSAVTDSGSNNEVFGFVTFWISEFYFLSLFDIDVPCLILVVGRARGICGWF